MKRILSFLLGVGLSIALTYLLRRLLVGSTTQPTSVAPAIPPVPPAPQPKTETPAEAPSSNGATRRYTVRTTGPRPQAPVISEGQSNPSVAGEPAARHEEPVAAVNTDEAAASPRSETTEPATPDQAAVIVPEITPASAEVKDEPADFTKMWDLGPAFNKKLHEAGINTYAALAGLSPQEIEEKTGISASRIERSGWIKQAARMAEGLPPLEESDKPASE